MLLPRHWEEVGGRGAETLKKKDRNLPSVGEAGVSPAIGEARPSSSLTRLCIQLVLRASVLFAAIPDRRGARELKISSHIWLLMAQKRFFVLLRIKIIGSSLWSQDKNRSQNVMGMHYYDAHDRRA